MSATGLEVFDTTLQKTHAWLGSLMKRLHTDDRHVAYLALRATLHALRDRLSPELAVHLGAQLPMLVRGIYYEAWRMADTPSREHSVPELLDRIRAELPQDLAGRAEQCARAVFLLLCEQIDEGEVRKVFSALPRPLRELWPSGVAV